VPVARRKSAAASPPAPVALALTSAPALLAAIVAAACVVISASYRLYDTDLWQHLAMGRAIWAAHGIPRDNLWTWPHFGEPYYLSSWGFRALVWPLWSKGGLAGLYAWRWLTTLAVFGILLATSRAMGARGLSAFLVIVWGALGYRLRTDVRPETLGSVLFALELFLLERRRLAPAGSRGAGRALWWIVPIAWGWANVHISYTLGFLLLGFHLLAAHVSAARGGPGSQGARDRARELWRLTAAAAAISFVNPFGWEALRQPFEFALRWRADPLFRTIGELQPLPWAEAARKGLAIWPLLLLWRTWRKGPDLVEWLGCVSFTALALSSQRFTAGYFVIAVPFVARDLHEWLVSRRWPVPRLPRPARAVLCALASVALCVPEWARPELPLGMGFDPATFPAGACNFMAAHGVRGRGFNHTHLGGYLPYRFGPDRGRLPFMSTQPEYSSPEERRGYLDALRNFEGWRALDARYHFDYVLLERDQFGGDSLLDFLDRDRRWAMVFSDDAAELLVRHEGPLGAVADSFAYRIVPAGRTGRYLLGAACERDSALRAGAEGELDRMIAGSPNHGGASHLRGWLALMDGDPETARRHLERAIAILPLLPGVHDMLGTIAYGQGRPRDALREFGLERRYHDPPPGIFFRTGAAWARLGERGRAGVFYRRELERDPQHRSARDSLAALESRR